MKKKKLRTRDDVDELRQRAEQHLTDLRQGTPNVEHEMPPKTQRLAHELGVHQIELEMQNDELRRARAEAEQALLQYQALADNIPDLLARFDADGRYLFVNRATARVGERPAEAYVGRTLAETGVPQRIARPWTERIRTVFTSGRRLEVDTHPIVDSGERLFVTTLVPERNDDGAVTSVLSIGRDLTVLRAHEVERQRLQTAIDQAAEVVVITDAEGTILYANPAFATVSGYGTAEVIGHNARFLKSGVHDEAFYRSLWQTISAGNTWHGRMVNKKKDGSYYTVQASISPVRDPKGSISGYIAVKRDITDDLSSS